jgi:hypothetical protein
MHRPTRPNPQLVYRFDPQLYRLCYDPGNYRNGAILPIRGSPEYRQVSAETSLSPYLACTALVPGDRHSQFRYDDPASFTAGRLFIILLMRQFADRR